MSAPATFEEMLRQVGWVEVPRKSQNGGHAIWRCPAECGQHQVSIPRQHGRNGGFDSRSPIARRIARCAADLDRKRQTALALQAIANPTPEPEPTPEPQLDPQPEREEEPMAAAPIPAPIDVVIVDGREAEVIAREQPVVVSHPRFGTPMKYQGMEKILLADGREVYGCLDCDHIAGSPVSVRNHRHYHSARGKGGLGSVPEPLIPTLLVDGVEVEVTSRAPAVLPRIRDGVLVATDKVDKVVLADGRTLFACTHLDCTYTNDSGQGVWVHNGRVHSAKSIARRVEQQSAKAVVRAPRPVAQRRPEPAPAETPTVDAESTSTPPHLRGQQWSADHRRRRADLAEPQPTLPERRDPLKVLEGIGHALVLLAQELDAVAGELAQRPVIDPEVVEKARRYDQLKALMGN